MLPEILTLGDTVLYEVLYSEAGAYEGARRIDDSAVVRGCIDEIAGLFDQAEKFDSFFAREVAPIPAPTGARGHASANSRR